MKTIFKNNCLCKIKYFLLNFVFLYAIININQLVFATGIEVSFNEVNLIEPGPINVEPYKYDIWTNAIKLHIDANGYDKKYGDNCCNNFSIYNSDLPAERKAKGYGQYTYKLKNLRGFIEFCHSQNENFVSQCATIHGESENDSCTYDKLLVLSQNTLTSKSRQFMTNFWNSMCSLSNIFIEYQDSYFFKENTLGAIEKIKSVLGADNLSKKNLSKNKTNYSNQSSKEYLTLLTTYLYSLNREEKLASVEKGDLVPFLYYAEHSAEDNRYDPYEIAKYAYIALMKEFLKISGTNYWQPEFDYVYFNGGGFTDRELYGDDGRPDLETLEQWYDETYEKYKNDRGVKQNPLIGSDPDTIISSNYTISYQVDAMKNYVQDIYSELGIDVDVNSYIARNELMARYMMENSALDDTIKDYNVSIKFIENNLPRGSQEGKNNKTAVLSDFQTVEFNNTIEQVANLDKDGDTLTNKAELGNIKWQDITGFVEKTYREKHGNNMTFYEAEIDELVKKNGGYTDYNGNFVYGHVKKEKDFFGNIKVLYKTYDYKSNPALIDTDFDGMNDNNDGVPLYGNFKGEAKIERNQKLKVDYNNDYRNFFIDNNKYNSELAEMSLMISNLANDEDRKLNIYQGGSQIGMFNFGGFHIGDMKITEYLTKIGFNPLGNIPLYNDDGKSYLYYKIINYYGEEKLVFGIFVGGFNNERAYKELVVNNDVKCQSIIQTIINQVKTLKGLNAIKKYFDNNKYCYWISGKNISGAIATGVASGLNEANNIYCYVFGTPNIGGSFINTYIKNIINEDDLLPKIHSDIGQDGDVYNKSIYWDLIPEYRAYVENPKRYKGNYKRTNNIKNAIRNLATNESMSESKIEDIKEEIASYLYKLLEKKSEDIGEDDFFVTTLDLDVNDCPMDDVLDLINYQKEVVSGNSTKAYWCLVKSLDGYDSRYYYDNNIVYEKNEIKISSSGRVVTNEEPSKYVVNAIKLFGEWYIKHVATYQKGPGDANHQPTVEAQNYWNVYQNDSSRILTSGYGKNAVYKYLDNDDDLESSLGYDETIYHTRDPHVTGDFVNLDEKKQKNTIVYNLNRSPNYVGDYCVEFAIAVIQYVSNGKRGNVEINATKAKRHEYGIYLHETSAKTMYGAVEKIKADGSIEMVDRPGVVGSLNFYNAMNNLGFKRYYAKDMTVKDLKPGDLLVSDDHVEFYFGYKYGKDKIGGIDKNSLEPISKEENKAKSTFGWGNVQNRFPFVDYHFYKDGDCFRLNRNTEVDTNKYTVVWRLEN